MMKSRSILSLLSLTSLALLTACLQQQRAPVDIKDGVYHDRYGNRYDSNGNQLPRYSNEYRAPMPASQDAKYVRDDHQTYGIEAPVAPIAASDLPPIAQNTPTATPPAQPQQGFWQKTPITPPIAPVVASVTSSEPTVDPMIAQRLAEEQRLNQPPAPQKIDTPLSNRSALPIPKVVPVAPPETPAALDTQLLPKGFADVTTAPSAPIQEPAPLQAFEDKAVQQKIAEQKEQQQIAAMQKMNATPSFTMPVRGEIIKNFAQTGKQGIAIAGRKGEPVRAAAQGKVLHVGTVDEYGTVVIIQHEGKLLTTYGHLGDTVVEKGKVLKQGDLIGFVGKTGNVTVPQLHFSVREGAKAVDPAVWVR